MELSFGTRLRHAWDVFRNREPTTNEYQSTGPSSYYRPDRPRLTRGNDRTTVTSLFNRIALDVASISINHCKVDDNGRFKETIKSSLNDCLNVEANIDQTGRAFIQDVVMSMLDEGSVAIVPVETTFNPKVTGAYDITSMRTGKIIEWYPQHVKVRLYNERTGHHEEVTLPKKMVAIVENPLFAVINEPNSTMQRLMRKLALLDRVDEQVSSGKLDMIIQLPYQVKSEARKTQAKEKVENIRQQLTDSTYGIAYIDATEKITQLNRPLENNLLKQIEYLTELLYSQLGISKGILDNTADEQTQLNYQSNIIEPIISAIVDEMKRKFLTKTARTQMQTIKFFKDPFRLVPVGNIADIADKFTRNEVLTSNEIRQIIGFKPSNDPKADELRNSNLNHPDEGTGINGDPNSMIPPTEQVPSEEVPQQEQRSIGDIPISELP